MDINYLSVCSGIEAASVAFEPLGWKPIAFSEIEPFPSAVLAYHYPIVPNLGDMTKWASWPTTLLAQADILVGGPPCQPYSIAGLRMGLDDPRGQLTVSYIRLFDHIDNVRSLYGKEPAICLYENVPGILSSKDNAFGAFLGGLCGEDSELLPTGKKWTDSGCVYGPKRTVAWRVLDAQYFGLAQRRKRVFVIASARDFDPSEILFEFDGVRRETPPSREAWQVSTSSVGAGVEKSYSITGDVTPKIGEDVYLTMRSQGGGIVPPSVCTGYAMQAIGEYADLNIASTCKSRDYKDATDLVVFPPVMQVRRLTPTECERLQGFPDGHTDVPYRSKPATDGPRYKALGNSMAVPVMHWIGRRINDSLTIKGAAL